MVISRLPYPKFKAVNESGIPYAGGKVYTYNNGTAIDKAAYSDRACTVPLSNPIILDANGEKEIYLKGTYTIVLNTALDVLVWTMDDVQGMGEMLDAEIGLLPLIYNLKPVVNVTVNKLDIFTKSGGAVPDAANIITLAIPDGNGYTVRSRAATYLSGTSQFILADAANYWSKGSLDGEIKNAYIYGIWDGTGIVWALGGYSGFTRVPVSVTVTDDDYFLLEASSTYTRNVAHYCVCVGKIRYEYDTGDTPDHTIQATVINAPQVIWNPKSDYGYQKNLATTNTSGADIAAYSAVSVVVKQPGKYLIIVNASGYSSGAGVANVYVYIKTGDSTYAAAVQKARGLMVSPSANNVVTAPASAEVLLNIGDTIHLGAAVIGPSANRVLIGDDQSGGDTGLKFHRID